MILHTESGSIYEVDDNVKCVRRLTGTVDPTPRQGKDGEWKKFEDVLIQNSVAIFIWKYVGGVAQTTITSRIIKVSKEEDFV